MLYKSIKITPSGVKIWDLRSDTGDVMNEDVIFPRYINLELPTGQVISLDEAVRHLEQKFGPWPKL